MKRFISVLITLLILSLTVSCAPKTPTNQGTDTNPDQNVTQNPTPTPDQSSQKKPNKDVLPKTEGGYQYLSGKTLSFYTSQTATFAADKSFTDWLLALEEKVGLKVNVNLTSSSKLYQSQLIAQKTGKVLDLISTDLENCVENLALMQELDFEQNSADFSTALYNQTGKKLISGTGICKTMWYNKNIVKSLDPAWTFEDFKNIGKTIVTDKKKCDLIHKSVFLDFAITTNTPICIFDSKNGVKVSLTKQTDKVLSDFAEVCAQKTDGYSFSKGTVAFEYGVTPKASFELGFAPLPKYSQDGNNAVSFAGFGLGLSKTVASENKDAAKEFLLLFANRYSEQRKDTLLFDLKLSEHQVSEYIALCENTAKIYFADANLTALLNEQDIDKISARVKILKNRYV